MCVDLSAVLANLAVRITRELEIRGTHLHDGPHELLLPLAGVVCIGQHEVAGARIQRQTLIGN